MAANMNNFNRDRFTQLLSETDFFKACKPEFVKAIEPLMSTLIQEGWDGDSKEKGELVEMAKTLTDLPSALESAGNEKDIQSAFSRFFEFLKRLFGFLNEHPVAAAHIGPKVQTAMGTLKEFLGNVKEQVPNIRSTSIREGVEQRARWVEEQIASIDKTVAQLQPSESIQSKGSPSLDTQISKEVSKGVVSLGSKLSEASLSPLGLSQEQNRELAGLGKQLLNVPVDLLSGKSTLGEAIKALGEILQKLFEFLTNNPEVVMNAASTILPALGPLGVAVSGALKMVSSNETVMGGIKTALQTVSGNVKKLETELQPEALNLNAKKK